jgi:hypothetical protein
MKTESCYVYKTLVIEYISTKKMICRITTDIKRKKYLQNTTNLLSEDINLKEKIIYDKSWVCDSYKKKYEPKLREIYDIDKIIKISKKKSISYTF